MRYPLLVLVLAFTALLLQSCQSHRGSARRPEPTIVVDLDLSDWSGALDTADGPWKASRPLPGRLKVAEPAPVELRCLLERDAAPFRMSLRQVEASQSETMFTWQRPAGSVRLHYAVDGDRLSGAGQVIPNAAFFDGFDGAFTGHLTPAIVRAFIASGVERAYLEQLAADGFTITWAEAADVAQRRIDPDFVRAVRRMPERHAGDQSDTGEPLPPVEPFTTEQIIYLGQRGVSADYIDSLFDAGYRFDHTQIQYLKARGVGVEYAKRLREIGYRLNHEDLYYLSARGVTADLAASPYQMGYRLSPEQLYYLSARGVSAEFITEANTEGFDLLTPEELYYMQSRGISPEYVQRLRRKRD